MKAKRNGLFLLGLPAALMLWVGFIGCTGTAQVKPEAEPLHIQGIAPISPQPQTGSLEPGLSVWYFPKLTVNRISEMPQGEPPFSWGMAGQPISHLDHNFSTKDGKKLNVFGSGTHRSVAIYLKGLIKFPMPGTYLFMSHVNDAIQVFIDGKGVINEFYWGSDRYSTKNVVEVSDSGWYSLKIRYLQRKGTARVHLFWKKPGAEEFEVVPAEAFAHPKI